MTSATLLAAAGGLLDAVVYLNHGHVFANAMTGNVIFLGIALMDRDAASILPHTAPILAFLVGVVAGAFVAPRFPGHAVWFAEPMLLSVLALTLLRPADFVHPRH